MHLHVHTSPVLMWGLLTHLQAFTCQFLGPVSDMGRGQHQKVGKKRTV